MVLGGRAHLPAVPLRQDASARLRLPRRHQRRARQRHPGATIRCRTKSPSGRSTRCRRSRSAPPTANPPRRWSLPARFRPAPVAASADFAQPLAACGCASEVIVQDPTPRPAVDMPHRDVDAGPGCRRVVLCRGLRQMDAKSDLLGQLPRRQRFRRRDGRRRRRASALRRGRRRTHAAGRHSLHRTLRHRQRPDGNVGAETISLVVFRETIDTGGSLRLRNPLAGGRRHRSRSRAGSEDVRAPGLPQQSAHGRSPPTTTRRSRPTMQAVSRTVVRCTRASSAPNTCPLRMIRQSIASPTTLARSWKKSPARRFRSGPPRTRSIACRAPRRRSLDRKLVRGRRRRRSAGRRSRRPGPDRASSAPTSSLTAGSGTICASMAPATCRSISRSRSASCRTSCAATSRRALLDVFSNRLLPDGRRGFFHPDNLTFGAGIFVSRMVAAAQAVAGVMEVRG